MRHGGSRIRAAWLATALAVVGGLILPTAFAQQNQPKALTVEEFLKIKDTPLESLKVKAVDVGSGTIVASNFADNEVYIYLYPDPTFSRLSVKGAADVSALKPGMYAQVFLNGPAKMQVTLVPSEAVIRTGTRNVVMLAEAMGRYRPVEVRIGNEQGNDIEVLDGLQPGQEVVVSGQFLLDSEASLLGAYQRAESAKANGDEP